MTVLLFSCVHDALVFLFFFTDTVDPTSFTSSHQKEFWLHHSRCEDNIAQESVQPRRKVTHDVLANCVLGSDTDVFHCHLIVRSRGG